MAPGSNDSSQRGAMTIIRQIVQGSPLRLPCCAGKSARWRFAGRAVALATGTRRRDLADLSDVQTPECPLHQPQLISELHGARGLGFMPRCVPWACPSTTVRPANRLQASSPVGTPRARGRLVVRSPRSGIYDETFEFFFFDEGNAPLMKIDPAALAEV